MVPHVPVQCKGKQTSGHSGTANEYKNGAPERLLIYLLWGWEKGYILWGR
jgi:hypothetical protein